MSKEYTIKQDYLNKVYHCKINSDTITSKNLGDVLVYIGKLHNYTPQSVVSNMEFILLLETVVNIEINLDINW